MPDRQCLAAQRRYRKQQALSGQRQRAGAAGILHVHEIIAQHIIRQRLIRLALRLAQIKIHTQQHIIRLGYAVAEFLIVIETLHRFLQQRVQLGDISLMRAVSGFFECRVGDQISYLIDIAQARVDLRLKEEHHVAYDLRMARCQDIHHIGVYLARPRPTSQIGDTLVVDRDHRDLVARSPRGRQHAQVISLALQTLHQIAIRPGKKRQCDQQAYEPVLFPKRQYFHATPSHLLIV